MDKQQKLTGLEIFTKYYFRIMAVMLLLALVFVAAPYAWMNSIHEWIGMGPLTDEPIVGYLARSTSAFYAMLGGFIWFLASDLRRYKPFLVFLSAVSILFAIAMLVIDIAEGMPRMWQVSEGPGGFILSLSFLLLSLKIKKI